MDNEELPRFGASPSKGEDNYSDPEFEEIDDMVGKLLDKGGETKEEGTGSKPMMSNDDSF